MIKEKVCFRCYNDLQKEKQLDYFYYCSYCDENFYEFETLNK